MVARGRNDFDRKSDSASTRNAPGSPKPIKQEQEMDEGALVEGDANIPDANKQAEVLSPNNSANHAFVGTRAGDESVDGSGDTNDGR